MTPKTTAPLMTLVVLLVGAVFTASASANWFVNGAALTGSAALATTAKVDTATVLEIDATPSVKLSCAGSLLKALKPEIKSAKEGGAAERLVFEGCSTVEPKFCTLAKSTIESKPLSILARADNTLQARLTLSPQTKKVLAEIPFSEENTCALDGLVAINGSVTLRMPTGQAESVSQEIEGMDETENNSLEAAGSKVFIESSRVLQTLASDSKWSFKNPEAKGELISGIQITPDPLVVTGVHERGIATVKNENWFFDESVVSGSLSSNGAHFSVISGRSCYTPTHKYSAGESCTITVLCESKGVEDLEVKPQGEPIKFTKMEC